MYTQLIRDLVHHFFGRICVSNSYHLFQGHANIAGRRAGGIDDGSRVHPGTVAGDVASKATVTISPRRKKIDR